MFRRVLFLVGVTVFLASHAYAVDGPCNPDNQEPDCENYDPDTEVPIDGGASILIAAGVAYGVKKIYDKRKAKAQEEII